MECVSLLMSFNSFFFFILTCPSKSNGVIASSFCGCICATTQPPFHNERQRFGWISQLCSYTDAADAAAIGAPAARDLLTSTDLTRRSAGTRQSDAGELLGEIRGRLDSNAHNTPG